MHDVACFVPLGNPSFVLQSSDPKSPISFRNGPGEHVEAVKRLQSSVKLLQKVQEWLGKVGYHYFL